MKERIVIDEDFYVKHFQEREIEFQEEDMCSGGNPEEWWHYKKEQVPETWEELTEALKEIYGKDERYTFKVNETNGDIYIDIDNEKLKASLTLIKNNHGLCDSEWLVTYNRTCSQLFNIVVSMLEINKGE